MLQALKIEPGYFNAVVEGNKTFDVRKNDRPFNVNDEIILQEYYPETKKYTGREWRGVISYILFDERFCKKGFCILGLKKQD